MGRGEDQTSWEVELVGPNFSSEAFNAGRIKVLDGRGEEGFFRSKDKPTAFVNRSG